MGVPVTVGGTTFEIEAVVKDFDRSITDNIFTFEQTTAAYSADFPRTPVAINPRETVALNDDVCDTYDGKACQPLNPNGSDASSLLVCSALLVLAQALLF